MCGRRFPAPWPNARRKIAEGLDAADKAARDLESAKSQIEDELKQARSQVTGAVRAGE